MALREKTYCPFCKYDVKYGLEVSERWVKKHEVVFTAGLIDVYCVECGREISCPPIDDYNEFLTEKEYFAELDRLVKEKL